MKVFLSYTSSDSEVADAIRHDLQAAGYQVWDPSIDARLGTNFASAIGDALDTADALVILVSPEAMESDWIKWEIQHALGDERFEGRLLPVELRPTDTLPWILRRFTVLQFDPARPTTKIIEALNGIRDAA
jgi:hypothetical protein